MSVEAGPIVETAPHGNLTQEKPREEMTMRGRAFGVVLAVLVTAGTTASAQEIFSDGFESGDTSGWTDTVGGATAILEFVVGAGSPNPPDPDPYGTTNVNVTHTYTLTNTGAEETSTISSTVGGTNPDLWSLGVDYCYGTTLLPGETCTLDVTFLAGEFGQQAGSYSAVLQASASIGGMDSNSMTGEAYYLYSEANKYYYPQGSIHCDSTGPDDRTGQPCNRRMQDTHCIESALLNGMQFHRDFVQINPLFCPTVPGPGPYRHWVCVSGMTVIRGCNDTSACNACADTDDCDGDPANGCYPTTCNGQAVCRNDDSYMGWTAYDYDVDGGCTPGLIVLYKWNNCY